MFGRTRSAFGAIIAAFAVASCGDSGTEPDPLELGFSAVAAAVAGDAVLEDLSVMDDAVPRSGPAMMDGLPGHLERERTVTFFDGDGQEQDAFDAQTTASIHTIVSIEGEVARDGFSASVERHRDFWVSGLEGDEETRTWNGVGSSEHQRAQVRDGFGERSYQAVSVSVVENVVRSVDREAHPWPLSGTITRTMSVAVTNGPNGDMTRERTVVIRFNGTQFAILSVDGDASHEVDLSAREGRNPLRGRGR